MTDEAMAEYAYNNVTASGVTIIDSLGNATPLAPIVGPNVLTPSHIAATLAGASSMSFTTMYAPVYADGSVIWASSDPSIATVDANGTVTALKAGSVTITATAKIANASGIFAATQLTVTVPEASSGTGGSPHTGYTSIIPTWTGVALFALAGMALCGARIKRKIKD